MSGPTGWRRVRRVVTIAAGVMLAGHPLRASQQADPPHVIEQAAPALPDSLAALRLSGWVLVQVRIDTAGRVMEARPMDPAASRYFFGPRAREFDALAATAARTYRFGPGVGETSPAGVFALPVPFRVPPDSLASPLGLLVGTVVDGDGRRLSHVGLCARLARAATLTLASGDYRLEIPVGTHEIMVSAQGYCPVRRQVVAQAGVTRTLNLVLKPCSSAVLERCVENPR